MKIIVNHLTRMKPGFICVAGIDQSSGKHVRPVVSHGRLRTALLAHHGGPFGVGAIVDLGATKPSGTPPEMEDHIFDPALARATGVLPPAKFWKLLVGSARPDLRSLFGVALKLNGEKQQAMAVDLHTGKASLGCLLPKERPELHVAFEKVKLRLTDGSKRLVLGVTDLRLYEDDQKTPRDSAIDALERRIRAGTNVILAVGLGRQWQRPGDTEERHFLQVNNLHLEDDPCWSG